MRVGTRPKCSKPMSRLTNLCLTNGLLNRGMSWGRGHVRPRHNRQGSDRMQVMRNARSAKLAAALLAALAVAACAGRNDFGRAGLAGAATPGSQQDFVTNVGDRVFFESDSADLTPQSLATLD